MHPKIISNLHIHVKTGLDPSNTKTNASAAQITSNNPVYRITPAQIQGSGGRGGSSSEAAAMPEGGKKNPERRFTGAGLPPLVFRKEGKIFLGRGLPLGGLNLPTKYGIWKLFFCENQEKYSFFLKLRLRNWVLTWFLQN